MQQTGRCPNCGSPVTFGQRFCGGCGGQLSTGCAHCGTPFSPGVRFCANCGAPVGGAAPPQQPGWGAPPPGGPQQPGWGAPPPGGPQQPGWGAPQQQPGWGAQPQAWGTPPRRAQQSSNRPLLLVLLVVLLLGLGGIVYWRWGDQLLGLVPSSSGAADTTGPVISNTSVTTGAISVIITWSTDELASSQVEYGLTSDYGTTTLLENDPASATSIGLIDHSMELPDLDPETLYHYRVKSKDEAGNQSESADATFETEAVPVE